MSKNLSRRRFITGSAGVAAAGLVGPVVASQKAASSQAVVPSQGPILLVNTGENLSANTIISRAGCIYSFDVGTGCYKGHYHHADLGPSAPVVVSTPTFAADKAFRYHIPGNNTGGNGNSYRSSLAFNEEWREMENWQGTEHWLGWAIRLDNGFPHPAPGWNVTMQFHSVPFLEGNNQLSPVWSIRTANDGNWTLTMDEPLVNPNADLGSYGNDRGKWVEFVVNVKYDCSPNGFIRVWKDGLLVYAEFNRETYNCTDKNFGFYIPGLYNSYMKTNSAPDFTAVISDFRIADETGDFDTVSPSSYLSGGGLPVGWDSQDIGAVGVAGSGSEANGVFTVAGSGADIWGTADEFHFAYKGLSGDGEVVARLNSMTTGSSEGQAGVMIRETLGVGSKHAFVGHKSQQDKAIMKRRVTTGGSTVNTADTGPTEPIWLKLERTGNTLKGYRSTNGTTWTLIDTETITMGSNVFIGLAVTSQNNAFLNTAEFDNVSIN